LCRLPVRRHEQLSKGTQRHDPGDFGYDVSANGQRFFVSRILEDDARPVNISLDCWLA